MLHTVVSHLRQEAGRWRWHCWKQCDLEIAKLKSLLYQTGSIVEHRLCSHLFGFASFWLRGTRVTTGKQKVYSSRGIAKNSKLQGFAMWHWNDQNNVLRFYQDTVPNCIELRSIYTIKKLAGSGKSQHLLWYLSNSVLIHLELVWLETKGLAEISIQESSMTSVDWSIPSKKATNASLAGGELWLNASRHCSAGTKKSKTETDNFKYPLYYPVILVIWMLLVASNQCCLQVLHLDRGSM